MADRETPVGLLAMLAVALGACCGVPLLLSAGALAAVAGLGLRNWLLIAVGVVAAAVGVIRQLNRTPRERSNPDNVTVEARNR